MTKAETFVQYLKIGLALFFGFKVLSLLVQIRDLLLIR